MIVLYFKHTYLDIDGNFFANSFVSFERMNPTEHRSFVVRASSAEELTIFLN